MTFSVIPPTRAAAAAALCLAVASPASAHLSLELAATVTHQSRDGDDIKTGPCGAAGSTRGNNVYTYRPGETINITVSEYIPHPGYFRIAFDADGTDDFVVPSGTEGTDGNCAGDPNCGPGKADYCNSPAVMWDNLDQHASGGQDYTWSITLPDIECDNCTIQIIQMMNDLNIHQAEFLGFGPYPEGDLYYTCIDIVLSNDAEEVDDEPVTNNGMQCDSFDAAATMGGGGTGGTTGEGTGTDTGTTGGETTTGTGGAETTTTGTTGTGDGGVAPGTTGTTGGTTAVTTGDTGTTTGTTAPPASSDSGGCTVGPDATQRAGVATALWMLGLGALLWTRRRA